MDEDFTEYRETTMAINCKTERICTNLHETQSNIFQQKKASLEKELDNAEKGIRKLMFSDLYPRNDDWPEENKNTEEERGERINDLRDELFNHQSLSDSVLLLIKKANDEPIRIKKGSEEFRTIDPFSNDNANEYKYRNYKFYVFRDSVYAVNGPYSHEEVSLLVTAFANKEKRHFESLSTNSNEPCNQNQRRSLSEKVRRIVWRRDEGLCVRCGSRKNLEYDHIIPVAEGGGNSERNIELLCEDCNRKKGKKIE